MVDFPIKSSIYKGFSMAMLNNQMVYLQVWGPRGVHHFYFPSFCSVLIITTSEIVCSMSQRIFDIENHRNLTTWWRFKAKSNLPLCDLDYKIDMENFLQPYALVLWVVNSFGDVFSGTWIVTHGSVNELAICSARSYPVIFALQDSCLRWIGGCWAEHVWRKSAKTSWLIWENQVARLNKWETQFPWKKNIHVVISSGWFPYIDGCCFFRGTLW